MGARNLALHLIDNCGYDRGEILKHINTFDCNITVCHECRMDDFTHIDGCSQAEPMPVIELKYIWMSFVDVNKLPGTQFLGVVVAHDFNIECATSNSHYLDINPGGEVQAIEFPKSLLTEEVLNLLDSNLDRLLSKDEAEALDVSITKCIRNQPEIS